MKNITVSLFKQDEWEVATRWDCQTRAVIHSFLDGRDSFVCISAITGEVSFETSSLQQALSWLETADGA